MKQMDSNHISGSKVIKNNFSNISHIILTLQVVTSFNKYFYSVSTTSLLFTIFFIQSLVHHLIYQFFIQSPPQYFFYQLFYSVSTTSLNFTKFFIRSLRHHFFYQLFYSVSMTSLIIT